MQHSSCLTCRRGRCLGCDRHLAPLRRRSRTSKLRHRLQWRELGSPGSLDILCILHMCFCLSMRVKGGLLAWRHDSR